LKNQAKVCTRGRGLVFRSREAEPPDACGTVGTQRSQRLPRTAIDFSNHKSGGLALSACEDNASGFSEPLRPLQIRGSLAGGSI